jgi:isocitrate dehydrogenase
MLSISNLRKYNKIQVSFFSKFARNFSGKIKAPPMVYISGEEFTRYASELYLNEWIKPHVDISAWEFYDMSCHSRDKTDDKILREAIEAGKRIASIYKEPTITPTATQKKQMGLKNVLPSPNGKMREGWNGISISRDTIHIKGMELGYKNQVIFDRHAVGGEYGAGYKIVGKGKVVTKFVSDSGEEILIDERQLKDNTNAVVLYNNPYDNIPDLAHHFFSRCLAAGVTPYIVTKKTVFKWQEPFWAGMKRVFDEHYKESFIKAGIMPLKSELAHLLSDVATMRVVRWSNGNFGMCSHNYDGDVLTDEIAQVHRSPGFLSSILNGRKDDGTIIKEFEASHGTVTDMWEAHLRKEETSLNPLSMIEALIGAINHSAKLYSGHDDILSFTSKLRTAVHSQMVKKGKATRDISGPTGLTTEQFVSEVRKNFEEIVRVEKDALLKANDLVDSGLDMEAVRQMFETFDLDKDGRIGLDEFSKLIKKLGVAPKSPKPF